MHRNPCGDGLGLWVGEGADAVQVEEDGGGGAWWEAPLATIAQATASRIGGSTSPYSPGTYSYGDPGYAYYPQPVQLPPPAPAFGITPMGGVLIAGIALLGLKVAGVF